MKSRDCRRTCRLRAETYVFLQIIHGPSKLWTGILNRELVCSDNTIAARVSLTMLCWEIVLQHTMYQSWMLGPLHIFAQKLSLLAVWSEWSQILIPGTSWLNIQSTNENCIALMQLSAPDESSQVTNAMVHIFDAGSAWRCRAEEGGTHPEIK